MQLDHARHAINQQETHLNPTLVVYFPIDDRCHLLLRPPHFSFRSPAGGHEDGGHRGGAGGAAVNSSATTARHRFRATSQATSPRRIRRRQCADDHPDFQVGCSEALAAALCMNIYVVGLNQIFDIQIDKAPLLRWKRHAFLAASCILFVRAILVQLAFFAHMQQHVLMRPLAPTKSLVFATVFMCCFSAVIALFKDIPDIDGDRDFGIQSLSVKLGPHRVSGHGLLAFTLWQRGRHFEVENQARVTSFYMFIWKLFYAEYFLIPFVQ
ncbi:hypothetical protein ACQ4PT_001115 [Festuca glaucescens]